MKRRGGERPYRAFDSHQQDTLARVEQADGHKGCDARSAHERGALQALGAVCEPDAPVAVETVGPWDWSVDEIEAAGWVPQLVPASEATLRRGMINHTDQREARGLKRRQRAGPLPEVWMPRGARRDQRELPRPRMGLVPQRPRLKNRLQATISKPGRAVPAVSGLFGRRGRPRAARTPPRGTAAPSLDPVPTAGRGRGARSGHERNRAAHAGSVRPRASDRVVADTPWRGCDLGGGARLGQGCGAALAAPPGVRLVGGHDATGPRQRRQAPLWVPPPRGAPGLAVGRCRSREHELPGAST
jgi:hypothetical protein